MPPNHSQDPRVETALDAALALLLERGEDAVIPGHIATVAGLPRWWFHYTGWRSGADILQSLARREVGRIADDLERLDTPSEAAQLLARKLTILLLAQRQGLLWEFGQIPDALAKVIAPAPWWIAAAWPAICVGAAQRGMAPWEVFQILVDIERRFRE